MTPGGDCIPAFEFATASRIQFGWGIRKRLSDHATLIGSRTLLITGSSVERHRGLLDQLTSLNISAVPFPVSGEPTVETVAYGAELARSNSFDSVIAIGGGSVIDVGKAIAALATNPGDVLDYLEVIGKGRPLNHPPLRSIAIPTTSGTGAEVTRNAVLGSHEHRVKVSLRHPLMLPDLALVDPELTVSLPGSITASTGMDALTQLIEPYVCNRSNPMTDALCREAIRKAAVALPLAFKDPANRTARIDMSLASLFGGLALANSGLGAVHGFAGPLGGMIPAGHGQICAALLPEVMNQNVNVLRKTRSNPQALSRYKHVAELVTGLTDSTIEEGIAWIRQLRSSLNLPDLKTLGLSRSDFEELMNKAALASSMKANPVELTQSDLLDILQSAYSTE